jgi:very-short-patch-repair endonuclease
VLHIGRWGDQFAAGSAEEPPFFHVVVPPGPDNQKIVRLARAQNGAITIQQLHSTGLTRAEVRTRVRRGRLVRLGYGVYAVGDPELMPLVRPAAALLSLGSTSFLSHRSAATLWELAEADQSAIDVTVSGANLRSRPGIRLHRIKHLHPADISTHKNLRLTSPARTLIDFASQATSSELYDAFGDARAKRLLTDSGLKAAVDRAPGNHPGAAIVRLILREGGTYDRSRAERILRRLCRKADLPEPLVNVKLHGFRADFLWPDHKLILEVDGYQTHGTRLAFESDRERDQVHIAAGYVVLRVTWHQLQHEWLAVMARLAQALARRAA